MIHFFRGFVGIIMRQIRAGHNKNIFALCRLRNSFSKNPAIVIILFSHNNGNNFERSL